MNTLTLKTLKGGATLAIFVVSASPSFAQTWSTSGSDIYNANSGDVIIDNGSVLRGPSSEAFTLQSTSGDPMVFNTGGANERLRITNAGLVGVGDFSAETPAQEFHVKGDIKTTGRIYGPDSTALTLQSTLTRAMIFYTDGPNERLRITNAGLVGVGNFSAGDPSQELHVKGDIKGDGRIYGPNSDNLVLQSTDNDDIAFRTEDNGGGDQLRMKVEENGNVGINASNPDALLHVIGSAAQNSGIVHVNATADTGTSRGIFAEADSTGSNSTAVFGLQSQSQPVAAGGTFGLFGRILRSSNIAGANYSAGVFGDAIGNGDVDQDGYPDPFNAYANGVQGETWSTSDSSAGVKGFNAQFEGASDGVFGQTNSDDAGSYGVYSAGPGGVSGAKSAVVYTDSQGPTEFYSVESTEIWFEHLGTGELQEGATEIELDQIFKEATVIDESNPMLVFLTPFGDVDLYAEPGTTTFAVYERAGGKSTGVKFGYRVVAKRRFYEDRRTRAVPVTIDPFMRPDLNVEEINNLNDAHGFSRWITQTAETYPTSEELRAEGEARANEQSENEASVLEGADSEPPL